jgi:hypothetical protein
MFGISCRRSGYQRHFPNLNAKLFINGLWLYYVYTNEHLHNRFFHSEWDIFSCTLNYANSLLYAPFPRLLLNVHLLLWNLCTAQDEACSPNNVRSKVHCSKCKHMSEINMLGRSWENRPRCHLMSSLCDRICSIPLSLRTFIPNQPLKCLPFFSHDVISNKILIG